MTLIALAADKGAPGVTTTALALSAVWPRRALLAEVDPAGGDLVYRNVAAHGGALDPNLGLLSLAATARRGLVAEQVWDHVQPMSGGLDVLVGLGTSEQAAGVSGLWATLGRAFVELGESPRGAADVIADCGRLGTDSPAAELLADASVLLLVSGPEPEQLARVRDRAAALSAQAPGGPRAAVPGVPSVGVLLVAEPARAARLAGEVDAMLRRAQVRAQVIGTIARDPVGAARLAGRREGRVDRTLLIRSARQVVRDLYRRYGAAWLRGPGPEAGR
ncbi:hypothetical protein [Streptomyces sp. NPDC059080]|uniref:hypothetical protein n=1 Tax=Streptomyces sp. NPDC059080 TaxID=3346718 RepID=UPI00369FFE37